MSAADRRSGRDDSVRPQLDEARNKFTGMLGDIDRELQSEFERYDAARDRNVLAGIRRILNRRRYIQNLVNEV